ncbi:MAG: GntR family transcriptional regulator [Solobacterium sp.]|nr:GntR family transcriptional regulator [Solobacterium sp.]MBR2795116.1 GntR family transcriptional regulator [Solobacterium sp.]
MNLFLDNRSEDPIYAQICNQIRAQILRGALTPGTLLPSMRSLAKDLRISVITTKRAYEELEKEGYIHTVPGKGCFVAEIPTDLLKEENRRRIEHCMDEIIDVASNAGISREEINEMWNLMWEENR